MNPEDLEQIRRLIDRVISLPSKGAAKPDLDQLEFLASMAKPKLDPYFAGKLREAVSHAKQASGRVRNKDHWISCMEQSWYVLESHLKHDLARKSAT